MASIRYTDRIDMVQLISAYRYHLLAIEKTLCATPTGIEDPSAARAAFGSLMEEAYSKAQDSLLLGAIDTFRWGNRTSLYRNDDHQSIEDQYNDIAALSPEERQTSGVGGGLHRGHRRGIEWTWHPHHRGAGASGQRRLVVYPRSRR